MANQDGWRNRITKITSRMRPTKPASNPAKLSVDLKQGAINPPSAPIRNQINRAKAGLKNQLGNKQKSVDGIKNGTNKTLGQKEEEALREQQGLPPKTPPSKIPGGEAIKPSRTASEEPEGAPEDDSGDEDSQIGQTGQQPTTPTPPEQEEQPPTQEPEPDDGGDGDGSDEKQGGPNIRNAIANRISNAVKKAALQAGKKIATFFLTNPYAWLIVGIIIVVTLGFLLFNYLMGTASQSPSSTGQSMTQAYDSAKDKGWLAKFATMSGINDISDKELETFLAGLENDLQDIKDKGVDQKVSDKIDSILADITKYRTKADPKTGQAIIDGVKELINMYGNDLIPQFPAGAIAPPLKNITGFNNTLHGGIALYKVYYKKSTIKPGHGTYIQNNKFTCDAVDLDAPENDPVFAVFSGKLKNVSDEHGHRMGILTNSAGFEIRYAHLENGSLPAPNEQTVDVIAGSKIGTISSVRHVHFEVAYKGHCIVTTMADAIANTSGKDWGSYLWNNMKKIFNL